MPPAAEVPIIDLMMMVPKGDPGSTTRALAPLLRDDESKGATFPAKYMFKGVPDDARRSVGPGVLLAEMDHWGIERSLIEVTFTDDVAVRALKDHPDRFMGGFGVDPNKGAAGVEELRRAYEELGVKAATAFPAGYHPQVPINDKRFFPLYATCVELDIPIFVCAGIPGPRVPAACQRVELIDEVCWYFPELRFVTRHGCEPWTALAVKLMLKWPNLYYSTSAFAPRHYPKDIVDFANTRGADKVLYAGYFPMGLSLERIMTELPEVPLRDHVWPNFLRENAIRVLKLGP